jgi:hypothetical protein
MRGWIGCWQKGITEPGNWKLLPRFPVSDGLELPTSQGIGSFPILNCINLNKNVQLSVIYNSISRNDYIIPRTIRSKWPKLLDFNKVISIDNKTIIPRYPSKIKSKSVVFLHPELSTSGIIGR